MDELDEIVDKIKEGECIPFIGAGVSKFAGCSGWDFIPSKLEELQEIKDALSSDSALVPPNAPNEKKIEIYEKILRDKPIYYRYGQIIEEAISCDIDEIRNKYLTVVKAIERIFSFSRILMTTNVDNCLDLAKDTEFVPAKSRKIFKVQDFDIGNLQTGGIFHLHGHRNNLDGTIFKDGAFQERYEDLGFTNFLCHVFNKYTILFIGYGLRDELLKAIIEKMKNKHGLHFALTQKDKYSPEEKTVFLEKYNIKIVEYPTHDVLPDLLQKWVDSKFPKISPLEPNPEEVKNVT